MTDLDTAALDGIAARAEAATTGKWKLWGMSVMADQDGTSNLDNAVPVCDTHYRDAQGKPRTFDAQHIAGMDPATTLALVAELRRLRDDVARVRAPALAARLRLMASALRNGADYVDNSGEHHMYADLALRAAAALDGPAAAGGEQA